MIHNFYIERDLARQLIVRALDGLGEGDRFRSIIPSLDVDMDTLNNFVNGFVLFLLFIYLENDKSKICIHKLYLELMFLNCLSMVYFDQLLDDPKEQLNFNH
jgi:hypothetical protein